MSKAIRRQLFDVLNILFEAGATLEELCSSGMEESLFDLLADCQDCAITIGNKIDTVYGEGKECVRKLEAYCEKIYLIAQNVEEPSQKKELVTGANELLEQIKQMMEQELPDKSEILFLPYKASMWDSLESVYLSACKDENCEAYVMPIPYFDKNPDKSFRKMHYEGDLFPKDIPITDYRTYDIAERRPDYIYIHNPYDEYNFVTSVHPAYYSSKLKELTEQLVYIPYFVLGEIDPESDKDLEAVTKFAIVPGVVNAHKVILETQEIKQAYVTALVSEFGENTRDYWEGKIEGIGSPKYDRVAGLKREDCEIPPAWNRIIDRDDGSRKKVILYNTSVNALLENEDKMLDKMQDVFRFFKENQEHVALLWRPHPLIKATIESLRPKLWKEYSKIVETYRVEGWGIYDDTADLDRAIVLSDAYYGDHSSLVNLYKKTEKPIMMQNVLMREDTKEGLFFRMHLLEDGKFLWMSLWGNNVLLKMMRETGEVLEWTAFQEKRLFSTVDAVRIEDTIYFLPLQGEEFRCYNVNKREFKVIDIGLDEHEKVKGGKFSALTAYKDKLYLFGRKVEGFFAFDLSNGNVKRIDNHTALLGEQENRFKDTYSIVKSVILDDKIYYLLNDFGCALVFDTSEETFRRYDYADGSNESIVYLDTETGKVVINREFTETSRKTNISAEQVYKYIFEMKSVLKENISIRLLDYVNALN